MKSKKAELTTGWIVAIVVAVLLIGNVFGSQDWLKSQLGMGTTPAATTPAVQAPVTGEQCFKESTTVTVGPAAQRYKPTTKATSSYHQVFKNGVDKGKFLDGSTFTANPYDKLEIYYAINDSQSTSGGYYAAKQVFTVPCAGEVTTAEAPDSDAYLLFKTDSNELTKQVFNWNNGNLNSESDNMTLTAGDKKTSAFKIYGTYQEGFSPYGKIGTTLFANSSTYNKLLVGSYPLISKPMNLENPRYLGSDVTSWTYELPGIRSNEQIETTLVIEVKSTPGDATVLETDGNVINVSMSDQDWYQDSVTGEMKFGYEDADMADVGTSDVDMSVLVK
jgi:hypothetical protein